MRALVTGAAGFIGSHLCVHLLEQGDEVVGVDALTDTYAPALKERNLAPAHRRPAFRLHRADLLTTGLEALLDGVDAVYHLAGEPGVRDSWGTRFPTYTERNVLATQRLLEAARLRDLRAFVFASSSSVYGEARVHPTPETALPAPVSPYGVTKLAAEQLCETYREVFGVPTVSLRLFTVYGPRQRPDMAFARLVAAAVAGEPFTLYGDGTQSRDFTHVSDVVAAMRQAAMSEFRGVANVGGGSRTTMRQAVRVVEQVTGPVELRTVPARPGDARHTTADIRRARASFGYRPRVALDEGLADMARAALAGSGPAARPEIGPAA
ncbi:NAD-dependent epimerase/dehydratase family protein [Streptomyces sp. ST1015]|uniref:NAD-dependent epimerase/dehydratase family protein n=1 Tax=unclassified Streptomyces TaxID=2593676 RepID=UPI001CA7798F|nr:NAD-dependent epimerase/dehydratase family protein [Streptomyces sp. ST1015]QZZ25099.1 NAD-dependent epimerase/dehydratase family protein [Streptomyces sp. ST1015]